MALLRVGQLNQRRDLTRQLASIDDVGGLMGLAVGGERLVLLEDQIARLDARLQTGDDRSVNGFASRDRRR